MFFHIVMRIIFSILTGALAVTSCRSPCHIVAYMGSGNVVDSCDCIDPSDERYKRFANIKPRKGMKAVVGAHTTRCEVDGKLIGTYESYGVGQRNPTTYDSDYGLGATISKAFLRSYSIPVEHIEKGVEVSGKIVKKYCNIIDQISKGNIRVSRNNHSEEKISPDAQLRNAIKYDDLEFCGELLQRGVNPGLIDKFGETALMNVFETKSVDFIFNFLKFPGAIYALDYGFPAPIFSLFKRKITRYFLTRLLEQIGPIDGSVIDENGDSLLMKAISFAPEIVDMVARYPETDFNYKNFKTGLTALDYAASTIIKQEINLAKRIRHPSFSEGCYHMDFDTINFWLRTNSRSSKRGAPLAYLLMGILDRKESPILPETIEVLKFLLDRGADVNRPYPNPHITPLCIAKLIGDVQIEALLVNAGASTGNTCEASLE